MVSSFLHCISSIRFRSLQRHISYPLTLSISLSHTNLLKIRNRLVKSSLFVLFFLLSLFSRLSTAVWFFLTPTLEVNARNGDQKVINDGCRPCFCCVSCNRPCKLTSSFPPCHSLPPPPHTTHTLSISLPLSLARLLSIYRSDRVGLCQRLLWVMFLLLSF